MVTAVNKNPSNW